MIRPSGELVLVYLWEMRRAPVFRYLFGDGLVYHAWAREIDPNLPQY